MELDWLEDFSALAEAGNFSRAAKSRNITQPAFSRRIQSLEQWAGVELFDRSGARIELTAAGKRIEADVKDVLRRLYAARDRAQETANATRSMLRLISTHVLSTTFFPVWMQALEAKLTPASPISLVADNMAGAEHLMLRGEGHFLLCHHHVMAATAFDDAHFRSLLVGHDTLIAVSAPRSPSASEPLHRLDDPHAAHLAYSETSGMGRIIEAVRPAAASPPAFVSPMAGVLFAMARDRKGLAWLPESLIRTSLERGDLVRAASPAQDIGIEIRLLRPRSPQSAVAEAFWAAADSNGSLRA